MANQIPNEQEHRPISRIENGMDVYDSSGDHIGTVDEIYLGEASAAERKSGTGPATVDRPYIAGKHTFMADLAEAFGGEEHVPDELAERLLYEGYIEIDADGLFAADRYVLAEQIASVSDDGVHLHVKRDDLLKENRW